MVGRRYEVLRTPRTTPRRDVTGVESISYRMPSLRRRSSRDGRRPTASVRGGPRDCTGRRRQRRSDDDDDDDNSGSDDHGHDYENDDPFDLRFVSRSISLTLFRTDSCAPRHVKSTLYLVFALPVFHRFDHWYPTVIDCLR